MFLKFKFRSLLMFLSLVFVSFILQAKSKVLLVSDVDDTIKLSHVRDKIDNVSNAFINYKSFTGMSDLYHAIASHSGTNIFYVSNAPSFVMKSKHSRFLRQFNFPHYQNLKTRDNIKDPQFKTKTILDLVAQESPDVLILIGDNGEQDPWTFNNVRMALKDSTIQVLTFVHWVYSNGGEGGAVEPLSPEDVAFVTPVEIALHLQQERILSQEAFYEFSRFLIPQILSEQNKRSKKQMFPVWKNCSEYQWNSPSVEDPLGDIEALKIFISERCRKNALIPLSSY